MYRKGIFTKERIIYNTPKNNEYNKNPLLLKSFSGVWTIEFSFRPMLKYQTNMRHKKGKEIISSSLCFTKNIPINNVEHIA